MLHGEYMTILTHVIRRPQLFRERERILRELERISHIPRPEQRRRYYALKPRLQQVFMEQLQNIETERALVGSVLIAPELLPELDVTPPDFWL